MNGKTEEQFQQWNSLETLLFFGIPGVVMIIGTWFISPWLIEKGVPLWLSVFSTLWTPVIAMATTVLFRQLRSKKSLLQIGKLTGKQWGVVVGAFFVVQVLEALLSGSRGVLGDLFNFVPTEGLPPLFLPGYEIELPLKTFFGLPVQGNGWLFVFWVLWIIVNIGGEELLWRGYALPRMEKTFGKWAWLVNGLCWNFLIHAFMPWSFVALLPVSLILPWLAQRYKSIWPGIFIHGVGNLLVFLLLGLSQ